jgi:hypothetical protein
MTSSGIETATFWLVAQCPTNYITTYPRRVVVMQYFSSSDEELSKTESDNTNCISMAQDKQEQTTHSV